MYFKDLIDELKPDIIIHNVDKKDNMVLFWVKEIKGEIEFEFAYGGWNSYVEDVSGAKIIGGELHYNHNFRDSPDSWEKWDFDPHEDIISPQQIVNTLYDYINKIDDVLAE
jgi:hypothetical protein